MLEGKLNEEQKAALEFQKWAVPCAMGVVPSGELKKMREATVRGEPLDIGYLRGIFKRASSHIRNNTVDGVLDYFTRRHNKVVAEGNGPWSAKELCMSHFGTVVELKGGKGVVEYEADHLLPKEYWGKKRRPVSFAYLPEAKIGDEVWIHRGDVTRFKDEKE
jgi:hypothetical protein